MSVRGKQLLSVREVASILFSTKQPQGRELRWVESQFLSGRLRGSRSGEGCKTKWTTNSQQLAAFMASESYSRQLELRGEAVACSQNRGDPLTRSYRSLLTDYFQAVVMRRRFELRDKRFKRLVTCGQIAIVLAVGLAASASVRQLLPVTISAEQQQIETWIATHHARYHVEDIAKLPADSAESAMVFRVRYRYFKSGNKAINTDRLFKIRDNQIVAVESN